MTLKEIIRELVRTITMSDQIGGGGGGWGSSGDWVPLMSVDFGRERDGYWVLANTNYGSSTDDDQRATVPVDSILSISSIGGVGCSIHATLYHDTAGETTSARCSVNGSGLANAEITHTGTARETLESPVQEIPDTGVVSVGFQAKATAQYGYVAGDVGVTIWGKVS